MRKNSRLPNFQNLGILLRILLIVNLLGVLAAILLSKELNHFLPLVAELSTVIQPILLLTIFALYVLNPVFKRLQYWQGVVIILCLAALISSLAAMFISKYISYDVVVAPYRIIILAVLTTAIALYYFSLQQRAYSPAIAEARLQALQARIRPHFLFNSINAVLSLIRSQPKQAEGALEDMADLFRVLMAENRDLAPLAKEVALCKQYLGIESLRLEDRLNIVWQTENMPADALIPPLILQPLLENAVYHGVEPIPEGGDIVVSIENIRNELHIKISNPFNTNSSEHNGNKMALKNIKERLTLHFDLEASISHRVKGDQYVVSMRMPYEQGSTEHKP